MDYISIKISENYQLYKPPQGRFFYGADREGCPRQHLARRAHKVRQLATVTCFIIFVLAIYIASQR